MLPSEYIPPYIQQDPAQAPHSIVTAARWTELFTLLITQGDYNSEMLQYFTEHAVDYATIAQQALAAAAAAVGAADKDAEASTVQAELDKLTTDQHTHDNKALLDDYTQTEIDIAEAVLKKHQHNNKLVLDGITEVTAVLGDAADKVPSEQAVSQALALTGNLPAAGTVRQALVKKSTTSFDTEWATLTGADVPLVGYAKAEVPGTVIATDTANQAFGKLEKRLDTSFVCDPLVSEAIQIAAGSPVWLPRTLLGLSAGTTVAGNGYVIIKSQTVGELYYTQNIFGTWQTVSLGARTIQQLKFINEKFVAVCSDKTIFFTTNPATWTQGTDVPSSASSFTANGLLWDGTQYVVGHYNSGSGNKNGRIHYTADLTGSWTASATVPHATDSYQGHIAFDGTHYVVFVVYDNFAYYTLNLSSSWIEKKVGTTNLWDVYAANGYIVFQNFDKKLYCGTSMTGPFTETASGANSTPHYVNGYWVFKHTDGFLRYSYDTPMAWQVETANDDASANICYTGEFYVRTLADSFLYSWGLQDTDRVAAPTTVSEALHVLALAAAKSNLT